MLERNIDPSLMDEVLRKPRPSRDALDRFENSGELTRSELAEETDAEILYMFNRHRERAKEIENAWREWFGAETAEKILELGDRFEMETSRGSLPVAIINGSKLERQIDELITKSPKGGYPKNATAREYAENNVILTKLMREIEHRKLEVK